MSNKEFGLKLKIDGDISDILKSLKSLQSAFNAVEMPDSLTKSLSRDITNAIQKVGEFGKRGEAAINSLSDSKEVTNAWKNVTKVLESLQVKLEDIDPSQIFPKDVTANLEKAESAAKKYNNALSDAKNTDAFKTKLEQLNQIAERQKVVEAQSKKASASALQAEEALNLKRNQWTDEVNQKYESQQKAIQDANKALEEQTQKTAQLVEQQKKLQEEGYLNSDKTVSSKRKTSVLAAKEALPEAEKDESQKKKALSVAKGQLTKYKNKNAGIDLDSDKKYLELKKELEKAEKEHAEAIERTNQLRAEAAKFDKVEQASNIGAEIAESKQLEKTLRDQAAAAKEAGSELASQKKSLDNAETSYQEAAQKAGGYKDRIEELQEETRQLNVELKTIQTDSAQAEWEELVNIIKEFTGVDLTQSAHDMQAVTTALSDYKEGKIKELPTVLANIVKNAKDAAPAVDRVGKEVKDVGEDAVGLAKADQEMENLRNQVLDFFSITNSIQLFKRAVTSALNTVKELDATMTEAAVVTEFDIGDMWNKLPTYTVEAQKLGVSINGMYQATTLYYQQGLKNNEAMQLGIETMKMGKIAAMDSTEATKAMTAALRGFNMELNETSAVRVNDVYSQLAAVTAADTAQIATAMEKTASIAASANMEFETTAALLAQIIETTQEAPETAGTALKTIIARFAEVKSLREQGQTSGKDSEGEDIDVNKIQTALRTVGISMEGFFNGTEGLDSILLKLSEKWGTLDFETQRYIATMAAGSRQQSRFIAMMSDYGRTTELVGEAQNSAGASQKQFEKTQESLATSLQKLKNAWDEFLMGLANNEVLKTGVDALTSIVETLNKATEILSGGNGLIKAVVSLGTALSALKIGKSFLGGRVNTGIIGKITGAVTGHSPKTKEKTGLGDKLEKTRFGLAKGVNKDEGWKTSYRKKREEIKEKKANRPKGLKKYKVTEEQFSFENGGEKKLKDRIRMSATFGGDKAAEFEKLNQQLEKGEITSEQAAINFQKLGGELDGLGTITKKTNIDFQSLSTGLGNAGMAMMGVGAGLGLLSGLFESLGLEEAAEATQTIAGVFMGLGTVLSIVSSILPIVTTMTAAQAAATWAALWPVLLITAALIALIAIFAAIGVAAKEASLEGRMQAAAEATEQAKESAEAAKSAYEDLLSAKEGYDELQNQLNELTRGTDEWKKALIESNAQVLELLKTYPKLAQYLERGNQGQLTISESGWEEIITQQEQAVKNSSVAVLSSQMAETRLQKEKIQKDYQNAGFSKGITKTVYDSTSDTYQTVTDTADLQAIYKKYQEEGAELFKLDANGEYSDALLNFANEIQQGADEIYKLADALAEYDKGLAENQAQMQGQAEAMLMAGVSQDVLDYEYSDQLVAGMAKEVIGSQAQKEKEIADKLYQKDGDSESKTNEYFKQLMKENGLSEKDMTGDDEHDLEVLYAKMAGIGVDEIPDGLKDNKEALTKEIAKIQAGKDATTKTETVQKNLSKLDKQTQRLYTAAISGDVSNLTKAGAENIGKIDIKSLAATMGYEDIKNADGSTKTAAQQLAEARGTTVEKLGEELSNMGEIYNQELNKIITNSTKLGVEDKAFDKGYLKEATLQQQKVYAQLMTDALANGATKLQAQLDGIMANLTADQQQQVLDMMGTFDFSQAGSAEDFIEALKMIGINIPTQQVEGFVTELKKLEDDFEKVDFSKIREEIKELLDLADEFGERKESDGLTQEERDELIKYGIAKESDFVWTGQEWLYIEGPMSDLQKAIEDNTQALLEEKKAKVDELVERGEFVEGLAKGKEITYMSAEGVFNGIPEAKAVNKEDFLQGKIEDTSILAQIFDLDTEKMSGAEILEYYKDSLAAYNALGDNRAQQAEYDSQVSRTINLGNHEMMDPKTAYYQNRGVANNYTKEEVDKLKALADMYDVSQATVDRYTAALKTNNIELINSAAAALKNSIEQKKQEKQYGKTLQSINTLYEEMGHVTAGMDGFTEVVNSYGYALGIDMTVASNWELVADNMELIQKAANGDIDAILALNKLLAQQHGLIIAADGSLNLENSDVNWDDSGFQAFMDEQYKKGAFEWAEVVAEVGKSYLVRGENGAYEQVTIGEDQAGQNIKVLQAQDRNSIINSQGYSGLSENKGWENPYDKYYNTVQKINTELRKREQLERQYQRLQERGMATAKLLTEEREKQLQSLNDERIMREALLSKREAGVDDIMTEYSDVSKYASYDETYGVQIDWNLINQLKGSNDEKLTSRVEEFISKLEGQEDLINKEKEAIEEINDGVWEIYQQGKDDYFNLENQIKEAVIADRQKEIDKLSEIDKSINETNSKLIESIQTQLDLDRQQRQNEKTEQDITDKQSRLLYLQQDSSGANALEIMQLQEEIDQAQEDYTDTLIDQKISELQRQNDEASQQRQRQIEIMQSQLDYEVESGKIWSTVQELMGSGIDAATGKIISGSDLETLLKNNANWTGMSTLGQMDWLKTLETDVANALTWLEIGATQSLFGQGATVNLKDEQGNDMGTAHIDDEGNLYTDDGRYYEAGDFEMKSDGTVVTKISKKEAEKKWQDKQEEDKKAGQQVDDDTGSKGGPPPGQTVIPEEVYVIKGGQFIESKGGKVAAYKTAKDAEAAIYSRYQLEKKSIAEDPNEFRRSERLKQLEEDFDELYFDEYGTVDKSIISLTTFDETKHYKPKAFKTGGLADFTGPAWLDGTKSKPEYILNASQTKAFFSLIDVLETLKTKESAPTQNNGDNTYDIDINVESIGSDYDVEQLATKIQEMIINSSRYRGNNVL